MRDLWDRNWSVGTASSYDVVATANALHWLDAPRAAQLFTEIHALTTKGRSVFYSRNPRAQSKSLHRGFRYGKPRSPIVIPKRTDGASGRGLTSFLVTTIPNSSDRAIRIELAME